MAHSVRRAAAGAASGDIAASGKLKPPFERGVASWTAWPASGSCWASPAASRPTRPPTWCGACSDAGAQVRVVMTEGAQQFVTPLTFQALTGEPVRTALWDEAAEAAMGHIELARWATRVAGRAGQRRLDRAPGARPRPTTCSARCAWPPKRRSRMAPAMNRVMWAQRRHPGEHRHAARARRRDARPGRRRPGLRRSRRRAHARAAADRRRAARRWRRPARSPARSCWSAPARPSRTSIRCASSATAAAARMGFAIAAEAAAMGARGDAGRRPGDAGHAGRRAPHRRAPRARDARRGARGAARPGRLHRRRRGRRLHAGAGRSRRRSRRAPTRCSWSWCARPTCWPRSPRHAARPRLVVGFAAETEQLERNALAKLQRQEPRPDRRQRRRRRRPGLRQRATTRCRCISAGGRAGRSRAARSRWSRARCWT